jgi:hypothetical protein
MNQISTYRLLCSHLMGIVASCPHLHYDHNGHKIVVDSTFSCGIDVSTSNAKCWDGKEEVIQSTLHEVKFKPFITIGGGDTACAIATNGTIYCW